MRRFRPPLAGLAAAAVLAATLAAPGGALERATLRLDGVPFRPELALTPDERARGLMFRRRAPGDGMLFVFPSATTGSFWMKNTLVPLAIVFFDSRGQRVARLRMTPCRREPCRLYAPRRAYRFALELPAADPRPATRLGPLADLRRLVRRAS
ncbi:MAG TPA: DUF192 domain-containing protein [Gaiellaceae bacterium]|nr:DUF192 domain-containing protein [Gaiellaceae bacterium]